jgi:uncharacterized lipoprotein YddW (UPF0748 family)
MNKEQISWLSAYWVSYTNGLNQGNLEQLAQEYFLDAPDRSLILLDAVAAAGRTYQESKTDIQIARSIGKNDIFIIFDKARKNANRNDVKISAWIEAPTYTFLFEDGRTNQKNPILNPCYQKKDCNGNSFLIYHPDKYNRVFFDPFNPEIIAQNEQIVRELSQRKDIDLIFFDDHLGLDNRDKILKNGEVLNLRDAIVKRYCLEQKYPWNKAKRDRWICDRLSEQVKQLSEIVRNNKKEFGVSIGGSFKFAKNTTYQDIEKWLQLKALDRLNVQLYRADNKILQAELKQLSKDLSRIQEANQIPVSISLTNTANGKKLTQAQIKQQIELVREYKFEPVGFHYHSYPKSANK